MICSDAVKRRKAPRLRCALEFRPNCPSIPIMNFLPSFHGASRRGARTSTCCGLLMSNDVDTAALLPSISIIKGAEKASPRGRISNVESASHDAAPVAGRLRERQITFRPLPSG